MAANSKSKRMMTTNRDPRLDLWAGLLILSSLAPAVVRAGEGDGKLQVSVDAGLGSVTAQVGSGCYEQR